MKKFYALEILRPCGAQNDGNPKRCTLIAVL